MRYKSWFQCINQECRQIYPVNSIVYRCRTCSSLLEVKQDLEALGCERIRDEHFRHAEFSLFLGLDAQAVGAMV